MTCGSSCRKRRESCQSRSQIIGNGVGVRDTSDAHATEHPLRSNNTQIITAFELPYLLAGHNDNPGTVHDGNRVVQAVGQGVALPGGKNIEAAFDF